MEIQVPPGVEAVEWMLLTNLPVETPEAALEKVQWYCLRFQIEVYHRTLKSGCKIEERQLGSAERIESCLGIDLLVAWRIVHLTKLGRNTRGAVRRLFRRSAMAGGFLFHHPPGPAQRAADVADDQPDGGATGRLFRTQERRPARDQIDVARLTANG